jgi:hypothetical protein
VRKVFVAAMILSTAGALHAQSPCKLEGVWQLVSGSEDGKPYPAGAREMKVITKGHFAFVYQVPGGPKDLKAVADSLAAYRTSGSGGGTYTLQGTSYTETLEYFSDPSYVGKSLVFTCRTEGDRFFQSGMFPRYQAGKKIRDSKLEEVWRRIE